VVSSDRELLAVAARVCTDRQLEAMALRVQGYGYKRLSLVMGISPESARDLVRRAEDAIARENRRPDAVAE
jgi:DNA-binding CsgD family transcriptional regulator